MPHGKLTLLKLSSDMFKRNTKWSWLSKMAPDSFTWYQHGLDDLISQLSLLADAIEFSTFSVASSIRVVDAVRMGELKSFRRYRADASNHFRKLADISRRVAQPLAITKRVKLGRVAVPTSRDLKIEVPDQLAWQRQYVIQAITDFVAFEDG